jgi:hypothetical protein
MDSVAQVFDERLVYKCPELMLPNFLRRRSHQLYKKMTIPRYWK